MLGAYFFPSHCNNYKRHLRIALSAAGTHQQRVAINYPELWEKCNIHSVLERLQYFNGTFVFRALLTNLVPEVSEKYSYVPTTHNNTLSLTRYRTTFASLLPFHQSSILWNSFPNELRQLDMSLNKFKTELNSWITTERLKNFVSH